MRAEGVTSMELSLFRAIELTPVQYIWNVYFTDYSIDGKEEHF